LARKAKITDAPRQVFGHIPRLDLVEMKRIKEGTYCCGGGANTLIGLTNPELARDIGQDRIRQALDTGSRTLVTSCPWCASHFKTLNLDGLQVFDLPEFLYQVVGLAE
jgi:Fe-S oxidoreductase